MTPSFDICVVGGAGHVGAPLATVLAAAGLRTLALDRNAAAIATLKSGRMPFLEIGGEALLREALTRQTIGFSTDPSDCRGIPVIIITIGTPIDAYMNPVFSVLTDCIDTLLPNLENSQTLILRSTVPPGATEFVDHYLRSKGHIHPIAFCPERVTQGNAIAEIRELPQLISGTSPEAVETARRVFSVIARDIIEMSPREAELAKLITNAFRYITFAASNQLYCLVESSGVDFKALLTKMKSGYPRMSAFVGPGFSAGPCLMKDTMQLLSFAQERFSLGHEAMRINEGLPNFIVERLSRRIDLSQSIVGILGMAFKANSDDIRESLSYKLRKTLRYNGARVLCTDEHVPDPEFLPLEQVVRQADVLIVGAPHDAYRNLIVPKGKIVEDVWNILKPAGAA